MENEAIIEAPENMLDAVRELMQQMTRRDLEIFMRDVCS